MMHTRPTRRLLQAAFTCAGLLAFGACAIGRGIGRDAASGLREAEPDLIALERRLADSMATFMGREMQRRVLDHARETWISMRGDAITGMDTILAHTTASVRGELNDALRELLQANLTTLEDGGAALVSRLSDSITVALRGAILGAVVAAADSAGYASMMAVSRGVERELTPALRRSLDSLRQAWREEVRLAVQSTGTVVEKQVGVHPIVVALLVAALLAVLASNWLHNANHRRTIEHIIQRAEAFRHRNSQ